MKSVLVPVLLCLVTTIWAQPTALAELKQSAALNKQALAHYRWQESQILTVDGDVKQTTISSVTLGPDGHPQKTLISQQSPPPKEVRGPLRNRIRDRKVGEFKDYVKSVVALTEAYVHPDSDRLQQAFTAGNLTLGSAPEPGSVQLKVTSYLKPGDSMTLVYNTQKKMVVSVHVSSYLDAPGNAVDISASFVQLPEGPSHVAQATIIGQEKTLNIGIANTGYVKRS